MKRLSDQMPVKSKVQAGKIAILYKQGKLTKAERDRMLKGVKVSRLPKKVKKEK